jgi:DNA-binding NarL/FixJ family response regulator
VGVVDTEEAARSAIAGAKIDLVLLDLRLREGHGFGVLRAIESRVQRPAVVVMSNYSLAEYRRAAEKRGAQYFLDKADEIETLPTILAEIRHQRRH